jgi:catechol 2,3-dioxygenase-like lactoylglutathione lyase family enzyme
MFSKIMYVAVFVTDQQKALDFYTTTLGFEKRTDVTGPDGRFLTIAFKGQEWEVLLWPKTRTDRLGTLFLESADLGEGFAELRARGVRLIEAEPESYPFGMRATAIDRTATRSP